MSDIDVIIIGGGPAGISAALWAADLGLQAVVIERHDLGGQLNSIYNPIVNYPGISVSNGVELRDRMVSALTATGVPIRMSTRVVPLFPETQVELDGEILRGRAVVIATGVRRRELNVPGEREFKGKGMLASGSASRKGVLGKNVVIVGGGDAAVENALILSEKARLVTVVHRGMTLSARPEFQNQLPARDNVDLLLSSRVTGIHGTDRVEAVKVVSNGVKDEILCDHVVIRIGVEPNSEPFSGHLAVDGRGYILSDIHGLTDVPGIYAIGDVARPVSPTISTAVGMGATAVKHIYASLARS